MNAMNLFKLDGRVALVTGGAGIYGVHITRALSEAGARVIIASRDIKRCEQVARNLSETGLSVSAASLDLASKDSILSLREWIVSNFGRLDILFNNAVARVGGDMDHTTEEEWESTMSINSTGLFLSCQIFGGLMAEQRSGVIVNISSIYGMVGPDFSIYENAGFTNPAHYAFSKGGMINFTRYLASYYGKHGVRVNSLSPGGFHTEGQPEEFVSRYASKTLLGRMAGDDDIKGAAIFLASDASAYITGHNLVVDGGWTAI